MAAIGSADPGKALVKLAAVRKAPHHLINGWPGIPVLPLIEIVPGRFQFLPVRGYASKIITGRRISGFINSGEARSESRADAVEADMTSAGKTAGNNGEKCETSMKHRLPPWHV
jgi:hypothetical protein